MKSNTTRGALLVVLTALTVILILGRGRMGGHASGEGGQGGGCGGPGALPAASLADAAAPTDAAAALAGDAMADANSVLLEAGADGRVTVEVSPPDHDDRFYPDDITVQRGATVAWHWNEGDHTVTSVADPRVSGAPDFRFCSGADSDAGCNNQIGWDTDYVFAHTFDQPGTYYYVCEFHYPMMIGVVRVR